MLLLTWGNIIEQRVYLIIKRTGKQTSHRLTHKAVQILDKYVDNSTEFIFGYLPDGFDLHDPVRVDSEISSKTALINKALKKIADISGIDKRLSTKQTCAKAGLG